MGFPLTLLKIFKLFYVGFKKKEAPLISLVLFFKNLKLIILGLRIFSEHDFYVFRLQRKDPICYGRKEINSSCFLV